MTQDQNAIVELVELLLRVTGENGKIGDFGVRVDLRIAAADLDGPNGLSFNVGLKKAGLSLDLSGLNVSPGTRQGEPIKPNEVAIKQKMSSERVVENEAIARIDAALNASTSKMEAGLGIKAGAGAKHSTKGKTTVSTTASENASHIRVKARGGDNWEVSEPHPGHLDGTYLNDEVLCRVVAIAGANSHRIELCAYAKQKDLVLNVTHNGSKIPFLSTNHEKMLKILIGKAISASGSQYAGTITFSRSETEVEK